MTAKGLLVTLIDPVIATAQAASAGRPESLSYLPGAMLLGAMAGRAYKDFENQDRAFEVFHSGALCFGDGLPLDGDGRVGYPAPLSLHRPKGAPETVHGALNLARQDWPEEVGQPVQIRDVAIALDGTPVGVEKIGALKTAIDPETGRAKDSQLFGLEALASGQRFLSEIAAKDPALLDDFQAAFPSGTVLRLGRSRGAEYGRTRIDWIDAPPSPGTVGLDDRPMLIWALSDIALDPDADDLAVALGLGDGVEIDASRSFLRFRRIWPYNGHWGTRGQERMVAQRGSIIAVEKGFGEAGLLWLGLHREIGCGRALAAPVILDGGTFRKENAARISPSDEKPGMVDGAAPVFALIAARRGSVSEERARHAAAEGALIDLGHCYEHAAELMGGVPGLVGPGPAQWSGVRTVIGVEQLDAALFGKRGIARPGDADWSAATGIGESFATWLKGQVDVAEGDRDRLALIAKGAAEAVAALRDTGEWRVRL